MPPTARRTPRSSNAAPSSPSPATARALSSAWNSHGSAHWSQYASYEPSVRTSGPSRPSGRRLASTRKQRPGDLERRRAAALQRGRVALADEHHVDVAGVVQLAAAELPHADRRRGHRPVRSASTRPGQHVARQSPRSARPWLRARRAEEVARGDAQELAAASSAPARRGRAASSGRRRRGRRARRARRVGLEASTGRATGSAPRHRDDASPRAPGPRRGERRPVGVDAAIDAIERDAARATGIARDRSTAASRTAPPARRAGAGSVQRSTSRRQCRTSVRWRRGPHPRGAGQLNTVVGDLDGNVERDPRRPARRPRRPAADLAVFPELAITGYPPEDLLLKPGFVADNRAALDKVAARTGRCAAVVGFVDAEPRPLQRRRGVRRRRGRSASTASACCRTTRCSTSSATSRRAPSRSSCIVIGGRAGRRVDLRGRVEPDRPDRRAGRRRRRAGRQPQRLAVLRGPAGRARADAGHPGRGRVMCPIVYVNQVGGQDELVFDGASLVFDADGELVARAPQFVEEVSSSTSTSSPSIRKRLLDPRGWLRRRRCCAGRVSRRRRRPTSLARPSSPRCSTATRRSTRRSCSAPATTSRKNGFTDVVIGLSGGIDSSLVARHRRRRPRARARARRARCRRATRATALDHRRRGAGATTSASSCRTIAIEPAHAAFARDARARRSATVRPTSPRRTCSAASAASS